MQMQTISARKILVVFQFGKVSIWTLKFLLQLTSSYECVTNFNQSQDHDSCFGVHGSLLFAQGQWSSEDNRRGMTCDVASSVQFGRHSRVENTKLGKSSFFLGGGASTNKPWGSGIWFFIWGKRSPMTKETRKIFRWHPFLLGMINHEKLRVCPVAIPGAGGVAGSAGWAPQIHMN